MPDSPYIPPYLEILDENSRADAALLRDRLIGNVDWDRKPSSDFELPVRRIAYQCGGFNYLDDEFVFAVRDAASAIGEETLLVADRGNSNDIVRVTIDPGVEALARAEWNEIETNIAAVAPQEDWDERLASTLGPIFADEWTIFSPAGSWIFVCEHSADQAAIAGSKEFMDTLVDSMPSIANDAVTWILGDGSITLDSPEIRDPDASLWRRLRGRADIPNPDPYSNSSCQRYLEQFYPKQVARELYDIATQVMDLDDLVPVTEGMSDSEIFNEEGPLGGIFADLYDKGELAHMTMVDGTPDDRLAKLISRDPAVATRLQEIWDGK